MYSIHCTPHLNNREQIVGNKGMKITECKFQSSKAWSFLRTCMFVREKKIIHQEMPTIETCFNCFGTCSFDAKENI